MGAVDPVPVGLARADVGQVPMPDISGTLQLDARGFGRVLRMGKKAELHPGGVPGEDRERGSLPVPGDAQRRG